jgi:mRNA degradation ribonuclease J1/J2
MPTPKSSRPDGLLTYADIAAHTGQHVVTIRRYASRATPIARRLRTIKMTRKTVLVRPNDWERFVAAGETRF